MLTRNKFRTLLCSVGLLNYGACSRHTCKNNSCKGTNSTRRVGATQKALTQGSFFFAFMQPGLHHFPAYQVHACDSFFSQTRPRNPKRAVPAAHAASSDQSESQSGKMDGCLNKNHRRSEWSRKLEACRDFRSSGHRASHKDGTAMQLKTSWAKSGASLRALAARARRRAVRPRRGMFLAGTHAGPRAFYVNI